MAMTIGRAWQLALLIEHAQWCIDTHADAAAVAAAARFAATPVDLLVDIPLEDSRELMR
jgi:D-serine deaminase-like pyridoxal phosphate-dependent protein